jgi:hypothetical protein
MTSSILVTGNPLGSVITQENTYLEGSPYIFFQDALANPLNNPDTDGFYWGLSGTTTYPVYLLGCVQSVSLTEKVTMNDVRCDTVGVKDTIQKRDYVEFDMTVLSQLPISVLRHMLNLGSAPTITNHTEKQGIGMIQNNQRYMVYAPKIYDDTNGYWLFFQLHRAKFVDAFKLDMKYGASWELTKIILRGFADDTKPTAQKFGTILRIDPSQL